MAVALSQSANRAPRRAASRLMADGRLGRRAEGGGRPGRAGREAEQAALYSLSRLCGVARAALRRCGQMCITVLQSKGLIPTHMFLYPYSLNLKLAQIRKIRMIG